MSYVGKLDTNAIVNLYNEGWSMSEIAEELDTTRQAVQYHLRKAGVERDNTYTGSNSKHWINIHPETIQKMLDNGISLSEIARRLNVCVGTVRRRVHEYGLKIRDKHTRQLSRYLYKGGAKLTPKDVLRIRELLATNEWTWQEIADHYGVSLGTLSHIKTGRIWGWLTKEHVNDAIRNHRSRRSWRA